MPIVLSSVDVDESCDRRLLAATERAHMFDCCVECIALNLPLIVVMS